MQQQYRKKPGAPVKGIKWDGSKEGVHEVAAFLKENDYSIRDILNRDEGVIYVTIDCHPAICLHISKQSWILIDSEFNLKVVGGYEFSQTYEPVSAPSVPAFDIDELWDEHSEYIDDDLDSLQGVASMNWMKESEFRKAIAKIHPSVQPQSEGGLQWVKVETRLPTKNGIYKVKREFDDENTPPEQSEYTVALGFTNYQGYKVVKWLDESAPPSTGKTEETGLQWVKGAPKERVEMFGKVMDAISNKVYNVCLVPTEGSDLWTAYGATVYFSGVEPERIVAHLASPSTANTEEGYWEVQYKNLWSLYQPLRDKAEEANREPQIAFAEWIDKNEYYKNTYTGAWHKKYAPLDGRIPKVFATSTAELYELFLTEYNKQ